MRPLVWNLENLNAYDILACVAGARMEGRKEGGGRKARESGEKERELRRFCIPPTIFLRNPIMSTVNTWPIKRRGLLNIVRTRNS